MGGGKTWLYSVGDNPRESWMTWERRLWLQHGLHVVGYLGSFKKRCCLPHPRDSDSLGFTGGGACALGFTDFPQMIVKCSPVTEPLGNRVPSTFPLQVL